ncbi:MAG: bacteriohemerythrin [Firmicutes bacterium HGW-Firmicutes-7]|nr:MAG: bacteriohemerythrin [Firmicutes bacterium HGW-Firmicutes-7]
MLKWKAEYAIGVKNIDDQHKHIFEIANSAYDLLKNDTCTDKYSRIVQVIDDLRQYARYHFQWEEDFMFKIQCADLEAQKLEHEAFNRKIDGFNLVDIDQSQDQIIEGLLFFVLGWIVDHILGRDKFIMAE